MKIGNIDHIDEACQKNRLLNLVRKAIDSVQTTITNDANPNDLQFAYLSLEKERRHIQNLDEARDSSNSARVYKLTDKLEETMTWMKEKEKSRQTCVKTEPAFSEDKLTDKLEETMTWMKEKEKSRQTCVKTEPAFSEDSLDGRSLCNVSDCGSGEILEDENRMELLEEIESDEESNSEHGSDDDKSKNELLDGKGKQSNSAIDGKVKIEFSVDTLDGESLCNVSECAFSEIMTEEKETGLFDEKNDNENSECTNESDDAETDRDILEEEEEFGSETVGGALNVSKKKKNRNCATEGKNKSSINQECEVCGKRFNFSQDLQRHQLTHLAEDDPRKKMFHCGICNKSFSLKCNLRAHEKIHLAKDDPRMKMFKCATCNKTFLLKTHLRAHERVHLAINDPRKNMFTCGTCNKSFSRNGSLREHEYIHLADDDPRKKRFECETCHKFFVHKANLRVHERRHFKNIEKRFKCNFCDKRFSASFNLLAHNTTHSEDIEKRRPFKCDVCGKRFARSAHLQGHKKTHLNPGPFECGICAKVFLKNIGLSSHKTKAHKNIDEDAKDITSNSKSERKENVHSKNAKWTKNKKRGAWPDDEESENESEDYDDHRPSTIK